MKYVRPDVGDNMLVYRGRRYWIIKIAPNDDFEGWDREWCDYVLYDCLEAVVIGLIKDSDDGKFTGQIISHVELDSHEHASLRDMASALSKQLDWYARAIS